MPDPNCTKCEGKGYTEWSSTKGGKPFASGRNKCECDMTEEEKAEVCPDCHRDWGHGYCGTCGGSGKVRK